MKKHGKVILSLLLSFALLFSCITPYATAVTELEIADDIEPVDPDNGIILSGSCGENVTYVLDKNGLLHISGTGDMDDFLYFESPWHARRTSVKTVTIDYGITKIGNNSFNDCTALTSITIPNSIISIGERAFAYCEALQSVTIPSSVTNIDFDAFINCNALTAVYITDLTAWCTIQFYTMMANPLYYAHNLYLNNTLVTELIIPDGLSKIEYAGFYNCTSITSVVIPDSVKTIRMYAFEGCTSLASVEIPDSVTTIELSAFDSCKSLSSLTLPKSVTGIGEYAFIGCESLQFINVDAKNSYYTSKDGVLYNKKCTTLICYPAKKQAVSFVIPDSVTSIEPHAFNSCSILQSVTIPNKIKSINRNAFANCLSLTSITIPDSVATIGDIAFGGCISLQSVTIPDSVTAIGESAFLGCTALPSIEIPDSVTSLPYGAFYNCTALTSITLPDSITSLGSKMFYGCTSLASITIPAGVTTIASQSFYDCSALRSIIIPASVTSIKDYAFTNCLSLTSITIPDSVTSIGDYAFYNCTELTSVTIGDSVISIGNWAFEDCTSLTSVTIPDSVTSIGNGAFEYCTSLILVTIPDSVTSIGYSAFSDCDSLTSVTIGNSVTSIGDRAFWDCDSLTSVTIPDSVTSIGVSAFSWCTSLGEIVIENKDCQIYDSSNTIPANAVIRGHNDSTAQSYAEKYNRGFVSIDGAGSDIILSGYCGDNADFTLTRGGTLHITGTGAVYSYNTSNRPWYKYRGFIRTVIIDDGITEIGDSAFSQFYNLLSVTIPDSVTSIGGSAFRECTSLTSVTILNPDCKIYDSEYTIYSGAIIYGFANSTAQRYAEKYNRSFEIFVCSHENAEIIPAVAATCTTTGLTEGKKCSVCGEILEEQAEIPALGHNYVGVITTAPTCTQAGVRTYTCECGDSYTEAIALDSNNHVGGTEIRNAVAATCTTDGFSGDTYCLGCSNKIADGAVISATGHDYTAVVTDPTCEKDGYTTNTCTVCGDSYTDKPTPSLGHDWDAGVLDPEPTPEQNGIRTYTCKRCSKTKTEIVEYVITIIASGSCGEKLTWTLDSEGTLSVSGEGEMTNYASASSVGWYAYRDSVKKAILADSVTSIGDYAFYSCTSLTSVTIPNSVDNIGKYAFYACESLSDVYYVSSAKMWRQIVIGEGNEELTTAKIHYAVEDIYNLKDETYSFANFGDDDASGHCFGMSMTSSAYYWGILNRTIIDEDTTKSLYSFAKTDIVKSPICYYQKIQGSIANKANVAGGTHYLTGKFNIGADWAAVVDYVKNHEYDHTGALQIAFRNVVLVNQLYYYVEGHAVNFLYYKEVNGQQRLYIYDNNFPNTETYLYKAADGNVYQAPLSTFDGAVECVAIRDVETYFEEAAKADMTRFIYAKDGAINVLGDVESYKMDGYDADAGYIMYEISEDMDTVQIVPLEDHATFTYCEQDVSFGLCDDDTMGLLQIGRYDSSTGAGEIQFTIVNAPELSLGDVDNDGAVTSSDARLALRAAVKLETLTDEQLKAADADKDGEITSSDARLILRAAVGLETL